MDKVEEEPKAAPHALQIGVGHEEDEVPEEEISKSKIGRRGTLVGTVNYVAPEMITDNLASLATDLWAFGVILFKMATGKIPFPGSTLP